MKIKIDRRSLPPETQRQEFSGIDLVRMLCTILVVMIHVSPLGHSNVYLIGLVNYWIQHYIARLAVPFFFISTGFLVFRRTTLAAYSPEPAKRYCGKILRLYLIWNVIYSAIAIHTKLNNGLGITEAILEFGKEIIIVGEYYHLWYLHALIIAVGLCSFLLTKKVFVKKILTGALILYLLGMLPMSYTGLLEPLRNYDTLWNGLKAVQEIMNTTRNGLFFGFVFIGIGMVFAYRPVRMKMRHAVIGFCISMVLLFAEIFITKNIGWIKGTDMFICLIPAASFLFLIASHLNVEGINTRMIRTVSNLVYYVHIWVFFLIEKGLEQIGVYWSDTPMVFVLVLSGSVLLSVGIMKLSERPGFRFLKKIYT